MYARICILVTLVVTSTPSSESTKWLIDNPGFDNPESWFLEDLPCAKEDVIFPYRYRAVLPLPKQVDVGGFVLPNEGALLLNQDATISLGGDGKPERECNGIKGKTYLKEPIIRKWFNPRSWRTTTEMRQNSALPHMERVPCNNESVIIQRNGPLSIDLENVAYIRVGQLSLAGSLISKDYLQQMINTDIGQLLFQNAVGVSVEYYHNDICGCHKNYEEFVEPICHNVVSSCARPHCLVPLTPLESCCAICGAALKFSIEQCDDAKLQKLRKIISMAISAQDLNDELDYHVNYINSQQYGNHLQAVIVDRHSYSEKSVTFVSRLNSTTDWVKLFAEKHQLELQFSGRPYNPNVTFGSILLIVLCLMFVSVVALVIFAHYAPDNRYLNRIPQWILHPDLRRWRAFLLRSPFLFARFDNGTSGGGNGAGGSGTAETDMQEHIIMGYDAESGEVRERAFDNPMFGENPQEIPQGSVKNMGKTSKGTTEVKLETGTLGDDLAEGCEEQELTEIKLETSSDDSDEEKETKE